MAPNVYRQRILSVGGGREDVFTILELYLRKWTPYVRLIKCNDIDTGPFSGTVCKNVLCENANNPSATCAFNPIRRHANFMKQVSEHGTILYCRQCP